MAVNSKADLLTPSEVIDRYPVLEEKLGWGATGIGVLVKMKVLDGEYCTALRKTLIRDCSVLDLVDYVNGQIEKQKVEL